MTPQWILITGATSGIGRAAALHLAGRGHRVIATGRRREQLLALQSEVGEQLRIVDLDVTDADSIASAATEVDELTSGHGLDVLVNNAGNAQGGAVLDVSVDDVRRQYETNVFGLLAVTHAFVEPMFARGRGRIINISSLTGRFTFPTTGIYNSTKHAVESLSDAMRVECKAFGVDVVVVEPGAIKTQFNATLKSKVAAATDNSTSRWAGAYEAFAQVIDDSEKMSAGPIAVARVIAKAAESNRPRARYVAPGRDILTLWLVLSLPTVLFDYIRRRLIGLHHPQLPS